MYWQPDRSLEGKTVVLVGGGPSHAAIDLAVLMGHRFAAINSSCRKVRPIATKDDILYFTDNSWSENHPDLIDSWPGIVICANSHTKRRLGDRVRYVDVVELSKRIGVPSEISSASSGHTMTCLLQIMGAKRVFLVGFECQPVGGRTHGHDDYQTDDLAVFHGQFLPGWRGLAPAFARMGVEIINATPGSAIDAFPIMVLSDALAG